MLPQVSEATVIVTGDNVSVAASNGAPIIFKASREVKLNDGFVSQLGAEFVAGIERCGISLSTREGYSEQIFAEPESKEFVENKEKLDLVIHPNPSTGEINLEILSQEEYNGELSLFDIFGNKVYEVGTGVLTTNYKLDLAFLQNGLYIARLKGSKKEINRKFILAK
jgi:hypothetical protein